MKKRRLFRLCWHCGRQLRGNTFVKAMRDGHERILHKICASDPDLIRTDSEKEST